MSTLTKLPFQEVTKVMYDDLRSPAGDMASRISSVITGFRYGLGSPSELLETYQVTMSDIELRYPFDYQDFATALRNECC